MTRVLSLMLGYAQYEPMPDKVSSVELSELHMELEDEQRPNNARLERAYEKLLPLTAEVGLEEIRSRLLGSQI